MDIIFVFSISNYTLCNKKTFKIDRHSNRKDPTSARENNETVFILFSFFFAFLNTVFRKAKKITKLYSKI